MKRKIWRALAPTMTLLTFAPGCQPLFTECAATSDGANAIQPEFLRAEVRNTPAAPLAAVPPSYRGTEMLDQERARLEVAAVRLADACWGAAPTSPECARWSSDIEAALSSAGYRVVPKGELLRVEGEKKLSTVDAAAELGVQVLFKLDRHDVAEVAGAAAPKNTTFFRSNRHGERLEAVTLDAASMTELNQTVVGLLPPPSATPNVTDVSSTLSGNAILVEKGAKIWFFSQTLARSAPRAETGVNFLFGRYPANPAAASVGEASWRLMDPEPLQGETIPTATAEPSPAVPYTGAAAAPTSPAALPSREQLIREQAQMLVAAFGGRR